MPMLTKVETAKTFFGIPDDDTSQDGVLSLVLEMASSAIEINCGREFACKPRSQKLSGNGGAQIVLGHYPIVSVESVMIHDEPDQEFEIFPDQGILFRKNKWTRGEFNIAVSYTAGYITPSMATDQEPPNLPKSLEMACLLLAKQMMDGHLGVKSERLGDHTVEYEQAVANLPPAVMALIAPFKGRAV